MSNSVLVVNISVIKNNIKDIKRKMKPNQKLCMVAKANCYGLSPKRLCRELDSEVDYFAVSQPSEFFKIKSQTTKPIIVLCPVYSGLKRLIKNNAHLTVCNFESLYEVCKTAISLDEECYIHVAVNTGMNRYGFKNFDEFKTALRVLNRTENIKIAGVFSHYHSAENEQYADFQYDKFLEFKCESLCEINHCIDFHISASDGLKYKNGFDMVRVGMSVYTDKNYPTVTLKSKVLDLQKLEVGEVAGYNAVFKATKKTTLAVVGIGYADGIFRNIMGKGHVLIHGQKASIVAVCMDSILVDVSDIKVKVNDNVIIIGKSGKEQIFICDIASWCDTIDYEILTKITSRVKRKYIK